MNTEINKNDSIELVYRTKEGDLTAASISRSRVIELLTDEAYEAITTPWCNESSCVINGFCECSPIDEDAIFDHIRLFQANNTKPEKTIEMHHNEGSFILGLFIARNKDEELRNEIVFSVAFWTVVIRFNFRFWKK